MELAARDDAGGARARGPRRRARASRPRQLERVFEPDFTTKGAAWAWAWPSSSGIVARSRRHDRASESAPGRGTTFPRSRLPPAAARARERAFSSIDDEKATSARTLSAWCWARRVSRSTEAGSARGGTGAAREAARRPRAAGRLACPDSTASSCCRRRATAPPDPVVIMISGHGTIATAVRGHARGAFDFLEKPLSHERLLVAAAQRAGTARPLGRECAAARGKGEARRHVMVGDSAADASGCATRSSARRPARRACSSRGESGTGKELVARAAARRERARATGRS